MTNNITNNEKANRYLERLDARQKICNAVIDLYWVYLPVALLWFILAILKVPHSIIGLPDMIVTSVVLFGEAIPKVFKSGNLKLNEKAAAFYFGISGFALSTVLLSINLIKDQGDKQKLGFSIDDDLYSIVLATVWVLSFVYAVWIRVITNQTSTE